MKDRQPQRPLTERMAEESLWEQAGATGAAGVQQPMVRQTEEGGSPDVNEALQSFVAEGSPSARLQNLVAAGAQQPAGQAAARQPAGRVFLALVHYPIYNKHRELVATSITNLDIHDISRLAATYQLEKYFLIHPHPSQRQIVDELLGFWRQGYGAEYNPDRRQALERVLLLESIAAAEAWIRERYSGPVLKVVTDAHSHPDTASYGALRRRIWEGEREGEPQSENFLLLFGTGHGLAAEVMAEADLVLAPILGRGDYNHLSVRSAAAIILDRLLGE